MTHAQIEELRSAIVRVVALAYLDGKLDKEKAMPTARNDVLELELPFNLKDETYHQMNVLVDLVQSLMDGDSPRLN